MVRSAATVCVLTICQQALDAQQRHGCENIGSAMLCCRYDVKYGSGGFTTYGWQAGCSLVNGSYWAALQDPSAEQFLCDSSHNGLFECLHDFSGDGVCQSPWESQGFYSVFPVRTKVAVLLYLNTSIHREEKYVPIPSLALDVGMDICYYSSTCVSRVEQGNPI